MVGVATAKQQELKHVHARETDNKLESDQHRVQ